MKPICDLDNGPAVARHLTQTPAVLVLDDGLISRADLLRLNAIGRLHGRGLPSNIGWPDLLQEAFKRRREGSRQPPDVPLVAVLAQVMRSIKEQHWRQHRRRTRRRAKLLSELQGVDFHESELADPTPSPLLRHGLRPQKPSAP